MKTIRLLAAICMLFAAVPAWAANTDKPNSFRPLDMGGPPKRGTYQAAAAQTWKGGAMKCDMVAMDAAGQVVLATATSGALLGCAANDIAAPAAGTAVYVYDDPDQIYEAQTSGVYAITMRSLLVDFEGATGIQEINENASLKGVLQIVAEQPGTEVAANARLYVRIARHQLGGLYAGTSGTADFGALGIEADVIAESTSATGVTVDGLLLKDGDVYCIDGNSLNLGTGNDLSCAHDGTLTTCTSATGDFLVDSTDADDEIIFRVGTDTSATGVEIRNNSDAALWTFQADAVLTCEADLLIDSDSKSLKLGEDADTTATHNGTNFVLTTGTGNAIYDNTVATGHQYMDLGTDTNATSFAVRNNTGAAKFEVDGSGQADILGNLDVTGGVDVDADSVASTWGASGDLSVQHNGTDNLIDSVLATAKLILQLGTDTSATRLEVENDTGADIFSVLGDSTAFFADNVTAGWGDGNDYACVHDGSATTCTNTTGDLIVDSVDIDDEIIFRLGTDTSATAVEFRNNSDSAFAQFAGDSRLLFADNAILALGAASDLACAHDGTDTLCTSTTGDFVLDNVDVNDTTILRLGTDTSATALEVRNNSDAAKFAVTGAGLVTVTGDLIVTGHVDGTVLHPSTITLHAPATEWGANPSNTAYSLAYLPAGQAAKTALIRFDLKTGDEIVGMNLAGFCTEAAALTLDAALVKIGKTDSAASTAGLESVGDSFTQVTACGVVFEDDQVLDVAYVVTSTETYGIMITGTTGGGDSIDVAGAWLTVNRKP